MCNILTSGFIDGIANTLETTIHFDTPELDTSANVEDLDLVTGDDE